MGVVSRAERYDIFLSYAREDEDRAGEFVRLFEQQGWNVFWDRSILPGQSWRDTLEKQLDGSRAVVVLWTHRSCDSRWVREEAERAARADKLVPVKLDSNVPVPAGFGEIQDADLSEFRLDSGPEAARPLLDALRLRLDGSKHPAAAAHPEDQLKSLCQQRAERKARGEKTVELDQQIRDLKRAMRSGPQLQPGDNFLDRFSLQQKLGQGGFGSIWKAWDSIGEQFVALKVLHGQYSDSSSFIRRFFRGARRMAKLQHPHIVPVLLDKGEEDDYRFFAMQYMPGGNLAEAVQGGALSQAEILQIILDVASALHYAWEQDQLVHRDVKPANILLMAANRGVLTDFDLVWAPDTTQETRIGQGLGTFDFGAPEVLRGEGKVTPACDVFSLARTALWALVGGDSVGRSEREIRDALDSIELSVPARQALMRALNEDSNRRFPTAESFAKFFSLASTSCTESEPTRHPQTKQPSQPRISSVLSPEEEEKAHDEARRFARLLVSEIKLYNENMVEEGRQGRDLYHRLSREIDRSREAYQKRIHPSVACSVDHFHEELVRILARGKSGLMGSDYPGSEALSPEEEGKAHDEARRFARLLVSEIKLYNEDMIEEGRQGGDLYRRLSRDIDRSRATYQKRIHPSVACSVDYFHDELVRILAKGDAKLLGSDYPGSPFTSDSEI